MQRRGVFVRREPPARRPHVLEQRERGRTAARALAEQRATQSAGRQLDHLEPQVVGEGEPLDAVLDREIPKIYDRIEEARHGFHLLGRRYSRLLAALQTRVAELLSDPPT